VQVNAPKPIKVASLYPPDQHEKDEDDQDCAIDADTTVTEAITIGAEAATEALNKTTSIMTRRRRPDMLLPLMCSLERMLRGGSLQKARVSYIALECASGRSGGSTAALDVRATTDL
jgi:hypothetical protein